MPYELECGHCGFQFVLDADPLPRSVQCSVCGGRLTLALPLAPPVLPPAPAPPVEEAEGEGEGKPEPAGRRTLLAPWPVVRDALVVARTATDCGRAWLALALFFDLFICPFAAGAAEISATRRLLAMSAVALFLPVAVHVGSMCMLTFMPPEAGGNRVWASLVLLFVAAFAGAVAHSLATEEMLPEATTAVLTAGVAGLFAVAAFAMWLKATARLGSYLSDDRLVSDAQTVFTWLPFAVVLVISLLMAAVVTESAGAAPLVWVGRGFAGVVALACLRHYAALLRRAVDAVERRAPETP